MWTFVWLLNKHCILDTKVLLEWLFSKKKLKNRNWAKNTMIKGKYVKWFSLRWICDHKKPPLITIILLQVTTQSVFLVLIHKWNCLAFAHDALHSMLRVEYIKQCGISFTVYVILWINLPINFHYGLNFDLHLKWRCYHLNNWIV